ncbi:helix-turn-helix protein [Mariniflexile fucanivorans]|uniref:Helix-turn-helix protein n=1 Tax=Mariniflexile fucanivorans TaxID=264023 RepID=A0A4R1RNH6_9FLAO|nr:AraC family transcriptional regulator [Mariniflexile fucanivorans]TCL67865.1 helix-turn-helix protein [Mariniflexile fucanivorans]
MKKFQVHSLPLKDVIKDFAHNFKTDYTVNCEEYSLTIPDIYGEGTIQGINFDSGLGLLIYNCTFYFDVEIHFTVNEIHPLKFLYCLDGTINHHFENDFEIHELEQYQNIIVASQDHHGHVLNFKKNIPTEIYSLEINRKLFKQKLPCELGKAKPNLQRIFEDEHAKQPFYYNGLYSLTLAEIFDEMKSHNYDHLIGKILSESQSYRMLVHQLIQFDDDNNGKQNNSKVLRKAELSAMMEAVEIIKNELDSLGSISSIAKRVGLNNEKFQNGFQTLYGKTANNYIQFIRLNLAKDLLLNTDYNIQEIKYKVGFKSHSYFTQLFKEIYHVTPSYFRKNLKKKKGLIKKQI